MIQSGSDRISNTAARSLFCRPRSKRFLLHQADAVGGYDKKDQSLIGLAKDAYPGADAIWSLSRVAFNDARTEALVQAGTGSDHWLTGETMLLHKNPAVGASCKGTSNTERPRASELAIDANLPTLRLAGRACNSSNRSPGISTSRQLVHRSSFEVIPELCT